MIKSILVCIDGSPYSDIASEYGIYMAKNLEARLLGLHVLDARMLEGPLMADISGWIGAQPYGSQVQQFKELMEQKGEAVINAFNDRCAHAGVTCESRVDTGLPVKVMLKEEAKAELVVMGQKGIHAGFLEEMMGSTVERVVRESTQPCLVTPGEFKPISKILAAYDGSGHAGEALQEATELALALKKPLIVLTVAENDDKDAEKIKEDGKALVAAHQCEAESILIKGKSESVILETAHQENCDLIVVGAYGHSRIREMILGSTTTQIITRSHVPVMLVR